MPAKTAAKAPRKSGSAHARTAGLVPVQLLVSPDERELIRRAAAAQGGSMGAFARRAVVAAAESETLERG